MFNNSAEFKRSELVQLFGVDNCHNLPESCIGISTDTRTLLSGSLFIALRGENFDGHDHIPSALAKGASCAIICRDRLLQYSEIPCIVVEDTLFALGELAREYRKRFQIPVIAVAGAAGKTSTKELVAHCLGTKYSVLKTEANFNNRIGVPLTMFQLQPHYMAAVIEIGTNEQGEIERLSEIVQPTVGIITNIGKEHLEKLIDLDGVEKEETALFTYLQSSGGISVINIDDERLSKYTSETTIRFSTYQSADIQSSHVFDHELYPTITFSDGVEALTVKLQIIGNVAVLNSTAATAACYAAGMPLSDIVHALADYVPDAPHGYARMVVQHNKAVTILNDCYNANPESMMIALKTLSDYPSHGKKIALLGDMLELGDAAREEHRAIIELASDKADMIIVVGEQFTEVAKETTLRTLIALQTHEECVKKLKEYVKEGDIVLVKGSRGMKLEKILALWINAY